MMSAANAKPPTSFDLLSDPASIQRHRNLEALYLEMATLVTHSPTEAAQQMGRLWKRTRDQMIRSLRQECLNSSSAVSAEWYAYQYDSCSWQYFCMR